MTNTTDPRAVEAWKAARKAERETETRWVDGLGYHDNKDKAVAAAITSYGDQRAAEERERVVQELEQELAGTPYLANLSLVVASLRGDHLKGDGDDFPEHAANRP